MRDRLMNSRYRRRNITMRVTIYPSGSVAHGHPPDPNVQVPPSRSAVQFGAEQ
ncbi:hypothetical protein B0H19DRAFT_1175687 [Mycena capillaripes]|nr:hypothetical protein B0H19DRAFT_1175687 [Mycena capillaripes]